MKLLERTGDTLHALAFALTALVLAFAALRSVLIGERIPPLVFGGLGLACMIVGAVLNARRERRPD